MIEIKSDKIKKWTGDKRNTLTPAVIDIECTNDKCRRSFTINPERRVFSPQFAYACIACISCDSEMWFTLYSLPKNDNKEVIESSQLFIHPSPPIRPKVQENIKNVSPNFIKIYTQALTAGSFGLDELEGMGYRKALEFLIKDFLCIKHPDKVEEIKSTWLKKCIKNYIENPNIKDCAERAAWLGNDETHYTRTWEEKDIEDLHLLLEMTCSWISLELLTEEYRNSMK